MKISTVFKTLIAPVMILGMAGAIVWVMKEMKPEAKQNVPEEKKWIVQTTPVRQGNFRPEVRLIGFVRSGRSVSLFSQVSSEIMSVAKKSGETVKEGDLILTLDNHDMDIEVRSLEADLINSNASIEIAKNNNILNIQTLEIEKKQLLTARRELERQQNLYKKKLNILNIVITSQEDVDSRILRVAQRTMDQRNFTPRLKQLESQRLKIELTLEKAQKKLNDTLLKAPFDGRLTNISDRVGQIVSPGMALAAIYDPNQMEVVVQLPTSLTTSLMTKVIALDQVTGKMFIGEKTLPLTLISISGSVEKGYTSQQGVFTIEKNGNAVTPGQSVLFFIETAPVSNSFLIPELAMFEDSRVYRKNSDHRLEAIDVKIVGTKKLQTFHYLVITNRLKANDKLLITRLSNVITGLLTTTVEEAAQEKAKKLEDKEKKKTIKATKTDELDDSVKSLKEQ
jgi:HlyD family secretion protein